MKMWRRLGFVLGIALGAPLFPPAWAQEDLKGVVQAIPEADLLSIDVQGETTTYRLFGVDSPEKGQAYFEESVARMRGHVERKAITLQVVATDSLGIPVARIALEDGSDLGEWTLNEGLGWWDQVNAPKASAYRKAMAAALTAKRGLWQADIVLSPADYRKSQGLPPVLYSAEESKEEAAPDLDSLKEEPGNVSFKAKGEPRPAPPRIDLPRDTDYMSLIMKHQPRIAKNPAGEAMGLTATDITAIPGAVQLGFQNGDVVTSVNGTPIRSEAQVMQLVTQLQGADRLEFNVIRGGQPVTISIPLR